MKILERKNPTKTETFRYEKLVCTHLKQCDIKL